MTGVTSGASKPRILAVDDNPDDLATFQRAVRDLDVELETASTGREGLKKALDGSYQLFVLDYNLGDMTGTEILLRLKEAGIAQPVLIQSGIGSHFVVARSLALGAEGFIAKDSPDYLREVHEKLRSALARGSAAPAVQERRQPVVELEEAIGDLLDRSQGVFNAVGFTSPDGFRVTTRIRKTGGLTPETICAMVASATSTSRFLGQGLGTLDLRLVSAEFRDGTLWSAPVGDYGFLFATTPLSGAKAEKARTEFELAVRELANLLDSLQKVQRYSY